jgi:hypothetical protein
MLCREKKMQGNTLNDMETGYRNGSGREECTGIRLDGQTTVENFGNRKTLKDATNRMIMIYTVTPWWRFYGNATNSLLCNRHCYVTMETPSKT